MRRRTFDSLLGSVGLLIVAVLAVAGGLLTWGHNYIGNQVHNQLAAQQIFFPATTSASFKELPASDQAAMAPYAGQQMLTGAQAEAYADHYIAVHLSKMPYNGVYAKVSSAALAAPAGSAQQKSLQATETTVFQGTTLRGLLLEAYAFGTMGSIAGWAALAAFLGAGFMLILSGLGLFHARRTAPEKEILVGAHRSPVTATA
ncbi:hypothetical protein K6U06_02840 [Acidiferrimicrobium sp. IK]|uniref:hypothetical protein n=1 Tax=Acidiferrimicrobium sp. IK TaxID=2871700 RepID=UPI0021CB6005|nr:hypothetical protein [Acidiferrimicrobium sp. IK]MCU4183283.1 hypothetical protein [Acidiferrimicrobium sp. IK]